jgi:hypothetical protein
MSDSGKVGEQRTIEFFAQYGLTCVRYTKDELRAGKTPDFKVYKGEEFVLYAESKHAQEDTWLGDQLKAAPPFAIVGGSRPDPIFNRLSTYIHEAVKQFDAVNPNHEYPNVLVFTSSDRHCTMADLVSVLTGNFYAESGLVEPMYKQISEGRIKYEKHMIDLYVWCNDWAGAKHRFQMFWMKGSKHYGRLCELLNSDPSKQKVVPET